MAASDDIVWQLINNGFCSYKSKLETNYFCRNKYNVTGLCTKQSCPLANSRYATIVEKNGICYLQIKTAERAHMPSQLWEEIPLSKNYAKALEEIDQHLIHWPKFLIHKNKQRLTKITQYLIRMRRLRKKEDNKRVAVRYHKKVEKRLDKREERALQVSRLDQKIKKELLERLKKGTYGEIYNFNPKSFDSLLDTEENPLETEMEVDMDDEFVGEVENFDDQQFDDDGDVDMDTDFGDFNSDFGDEGESNNNNDDHFEPNDIDDLNKLFNSYKDKDLEQSVHKKGPKKHIEIEFEKDENVQYEKN